MHAWYTLDEFINQHGQIYYKNNIYFYRPHQNRTCGSGLRLLIRGSIPNYHQVITNVVAHLKYYIVTVSLIFCMTTVILYWCLHLDKRGGHSIWLSYILLPGYSLPLSFFPYNAIYYKPNTCTGNCAKEQDALPSLPRVHNPITCTRANPCSRTSSII